MENLFYQKTEINKRLNDWEERNKNRLLLETTLAEEKALTKQENLINVEDKIAHIENSKNETSVN